MHKINKNNFIIVWRYIINEKYVLVNNDNFNYYFNFKKNKIDKYYI